MNNDDYDENVNVLTSNILCIMLVSDSFRHDKFVKT